MSRFEMMGLDPCVLVGHIPRPVQVVFATTGAIWLLAKSLNCLRFLFSVFIARGRNLRKYGGRGTWAVVTGASDGLGKEFALQLAAQGFSLVLVSRTQSKLDAVADEIAARFGPDKGAVRTRTLALDFARNDAADYGRLAELVVGLDIGILINNVGQSHNIPVPFAHTAPDELQSIVAVNCLGTLKTTQAVLPAMLARRRPGLILTMGSFAGWTPTPYLATYSGSKAFLQQWSSALAEELRPQGIEVQMCLSYLITTAMSKVRRANSLIPAPRPFVAAALAKIGCGRWQEAAYTFTPWWSHAAMLYMAESTIGATNRLLVWYNLVMHRDIRNRALRKAARQAKERQQQPQE